MGIVRIDFPNPAPVSITDWEDIINVTEFLSLGVGNPVDYDFSSNTIKQGVQIMIGGSVYQSTTATAITGTPSDYVQITPAGATASAAYVASLAGVTWNSVYNHYEDVSGNAYLFNEAKAGLADPKTIVGKFSKLGYMQKLLIGTTTDTGESLMVGSGGMRVTGSTDNVIIDSTGLLTAGVGISVDTISEKTASTGVSVQAESGEQLLTKIIQIGDWNMLASAFVGVTHGVDYKKIRSIGVIIRNDGDNNFDVLEKTQVTGAIEGGINSINTTDISLFRTTGGTFDAASWSSTSFNRGWVTITYEL